MPHDTWKHKVRVLGHAFPIENCALRNLLWTLGVHKGPSNAMENLSRGCQDHEKAGHHQSRRCVTGISVTGWFKAHPVGAAFAASQSGGVAVVQTWGKEGIPHPGSSVFRHLSWQELMFAKPDWNWKDLSHGTSFADRHVGRIAVGSRWRQDCGHYILPRISCATLFRHRQHGIFP